MANFTGDQIKNSFQRVVQYDNGSLQDGLGSPLSGSVGISGSVYITGSQVVKQSLTVSGSGTVKGNLEVKGDLTARSIITQLTSSTVLFRSGSTQFGDSIDDAHTFTGSISVTGSTTSTTFSGIFNGALSSSAQIADDISGSFTATSSSISTRLTTAESELGNTLISGAAQIASEISGSSTSLSSSLASRLATAESELGNTLISSSAQIADDISGSIGTTSASLATDIATNLASINALDDTYATDAQVLAQTASLSSSLATDIATRALTTNISGSFTTTSASLAADIATNSASVAGFTTGKLNSGSFSLKLDAVTGSVAFTEGLEIGDLYDQGNGTTDLRVPSGASWIELNYADTDFIFLDGTDAGINLDNTYEWRFYGATGTMIAPGEIRGGSISGSVVRATTEIVLKPTNPLPASPSTGSLAVTGSSLVFYNGNNWLAFSGSIIA